MTETCILKRITRIRIQVPINSTTQIQQQIKIQILLELKLKYQQFAIKIAPCPLSVARFVASGYGMRVRAERCRSLQLPPRPMQRLVTRGDSKVCVAVRPTALLVHYVKTLLLLTSTRLLSSWRSRSRTLHSRRLPLRMPSAPLMNLHLRQTGWPQSAPNLRTWRPVRCAASRKWAARRVPTLNTRASHGVCQCDRSSLLKQTQTVSYKLKLTISQLKLKCFLIDKK